MSDLITAIDNEPWMAHPRRNCAIPPDLTGKDVQIRADMWFPTDREAETAKELCGGCPVREQCLTYALIRPELEGIWGGTSTSGRARLRTQHAVELGIARAKRGAAA